MLRKPKVSVLMSVFNDERYLKESIESILNQNFSDFEYIIVNDGSTDKSVSIINQFVAQDSRILFIDRNENKGLPYSLNEGLMLAKGEYVARMDADDISLPYRLQEQVEFLEKHADVGVCGSAAFIIDGEGKVNGCYFPPKTHEEAKVQTLFSACFIHPSVLIRASVFKRLEYPYCNSCQNSQDYELWSRLIHVTDFYNIQKPLIYYRRATGSISDITNKDSFLIRFPVLQPVHNRLLSEIGIRNNKYEAELHFQLSVIEEMKRSSCPISDIERYFDKILKSNNLREYFDQKLLYRLLCRKLFIYFILNRDHSFLDKQCLKFIFSQKFIFGALIVFFGSGHRRLRYMKETLSNSINLEIIRQSPTR